jgi:hypothetical protein
MKIEGINLSKHSMINIVNHPADVSHISTQWTAECRCGKAILFGKNKNALKKQFDDHVKAQK